jgi:hypothetical protein
MSTKTEENYERSHSGYPVSMPGFELGTPDTNHFIDTRLIGMKNSIDSPHVRSYVGIIRTDL